MKDDNGANLKGYLFKEYQDSKSMVLCGSKSSGISNYILPDPERSDQIRDPTLQWQTWMIIGVRNVHTHKMYMFIYMQSSPILKNGFKVHAHAQETELFCFILFLLLYGYFDRNTGKRSLVLLLKESVLSLYRKHITSSSILHGDFDPRTGNRSSSSSTSCPQRLYFPENFAALLSSD